MKILGLADDVNMLRLIKLQPTWIRFCMPLKYAYLNSNVFLRSHLGILFRVILSVIVYYTTFLLLVFMFRPETHQLKFFMIKHEFIVFTLV